MTDETRERVSKEINWMADFLHDATRWSQRCEADDKGRTPLERLVEAIDRIYLAEHEGDGDEPWTKDWLLSIGGEKDRRESRDIGEKITLYEGVVEFFFWDSGDSPDVQLRDGLSLNHIKTRHDVRQLVRVLGGKCE